MEFSVTQVSHK